MSKDFRWGGLRLVLASACLLVGAAVAVAGLAFLAPVWGLALAGLLVLACRTPAWRGGGWAHGTARIADREDLDAAGMLGEEGLLLGEVPAERQPLREAVSDLFRLPWARSEQACRRFLAALTGRPVGGPLLRLATYQNVLVTAPTGAGKGVSLCIPWLLEYTSGSCVVIDLKGELYQKTAASRRDQLGQRVVRLDPFQVCGAGGDTFNPLDLIPDGPEVIDAARGLAAALVVRTGMEQDEHWQDSAENLLAALLAFVLTRFQHGERNLASVREVLTDPALFAKASELMTAAGGPLRRLAGMLAALEGKELAGVKSTANRHSVFLDSPAIEAVTSRSTFDARSLLGGDTTVYLILPPDQMAQARWLRLVLSSFIRLIGREGEGQECLFLLDEAGQLGNMPALEQGLTLLRARGLKLALFYQSVDQIKATFRGKESLVGDNCDARLYFGVNSYATADLVSAMLGDATITVDSYAENESRSWHEGGYHPDGGVNVSRSGNRSWQEQARRLLKPEEVLALDGMTLLAFVKGVPPVLCRRVLYYRHPRYTVGPRRAPPTGRRAAEWGYVILTMLAVALVWAFLRQF